MVAIAFATAAVIFNALNCILFKDAMKRGDYAWISLIVFHVVAVLLLLIFTDIPPILDLPPSAILLLCLGCLFWVFGDLYGVKAYSYLDASVCELYGTLKLLLIATVGILLFGETLSALAIIGMLLIIGSIAHECRGDAKHSPRGVSYMLLNVFLIAGALSIDKHLTTLIAEEIIVFYGFLIPMCVYLILGYKSIPQTKQLLSETRYLFLLTPILGIASYACLIRALAIGDLAITYTIQETAVVFIFLFEVLLLRIKKDLFTRAGSCLACATGAVMVCML